MRTWIKAGLAAAVTLAATPALAFTVAPATSTPTARQFADPDEALETATSALRDSVVENNLRAAGGPLTGEVPGSSGSAYGYPSARFGSEPMAEDAPPNEADFGSARGYGALLGSVPYRRSH